MDEEPIKPPQYSLGNDLAKLSIRELEALRESLVEEADRVAAEIAKKSMSRAAADGFFKS